MEMELKMEMQVVSYNYFSSINHFDQLKKNQFTDMHLSAEGHIVACHRVILANMSPFMERMLLPHYTQHPVIVLSPDVTHQDLQDILSYVYTGQCEVSSERLEHLLDVGNNLEIKGMYRNDNNNNQTAPTSQLEAPAMPKQAAPAKAKPTKRPALPRKLSTAVRSKDFKIRLPAPKEQPAPEVKPNFQCLHCAKRYKTERTHAVHSRECSLNPNKIDSQCPICGMNVKASQLTRHKNAHKKAAAYAEHADSADVSMGSF